MNEFFRTPSGSNPCPVCLPRSVVCSGEGVVDVKSGMSRREVLALAPMVCAPNPVWGGSGNGALMWDWFMRELGSADDRRRKSLVAIRTRDELSAMQEKVRRLMLTGIGAFPERTPLNPRHVGEVSR